MAHGTREFTKDKLHKMEASGRVPANLDRDRDAMGDDFGFTAAHSSNSAELKHGGVAKKAHLGRARRASGGKVDHSREMNTASVDATHLGDAVKLRARGGGVQSEGARDAESDAKANRMSAGEKEDYANERRGGRTKRADGGPTPMTDEYMSRRSGNSPSSDYVWRDELNYAKHEDDLATPGPTKANAALRNRGGRTHNAEHRHHRASGGRAGKGKTVVNVIVGRGGPPQGAMPMPPPMAAPPPPMAAPPPPMPAPRPPMGGPPMGPMPIGGAPMGAMGAPPPGAMPMRARGGKVDGHYNFGPGGTEAKATCKKAGGGGGEGRLEKAHREGARY